MTRLYSFSYKCFDIIFHIRFSMFVLFFFYFFFYANHPLQGFRSHCSVRGYYSLRSPLPGPKPLLGQGDNTHTHTHTQPPTQPFITSKHDMKSLLVREQVDGSTVLSIFPDNTFLISQKLSRHNSKYVNLNRNI